jgi:hypothetical protein
VREPERNQHLFLLIVEKIDSMVSEGIRRAVLFGAVVLMVFAAVCGAGCDDDEYGGNSYSEDYTSTGNSNSGSSSAPGYLSILTNPAGASVYVDGQYWGETDGYNDFVVPVTGGTCKVEIYKDGYDPYQQYVQVPPGEEWVLEVSLQQAGYTPYYTPEPTYSDWDWNEEPTGDGPVYVAATRPVY